MKVQSIGIKQNYNYYGRNSKMPSFGRAWEEHTSWGASYLAKEGKTNFKLFSFPDAKAVFVEIANKANVGLSKFNEKVVKLIATMGTAFSINDVLTSDDKSKIYPMDNKGEGIFEAKDIPATPDDKYRFVIVQNDNTVNLVKDPYAFKQENIHGWSSIYDKNKYVWQNTDWIDGKDPRRISRKPEEKLRGLDKLIIEEVNIPTLSEEGTFEKAKAYIDDVAQKGVATAIELLPVENTYSLQWGYDGVDKHAVNEKMGGADELKSLIDYAHGKGLNVIMDMVPNHQGPDGNYLDKTGPYKKSNNRFGIALNYEGTDNKYVREWIVNAALMYAKEFHVDGIRFDMTKDCESDYLLKQIVLELNHHTPNVFTIAEDARENKPSVTRYEAFEIPHEKAINYIDNQIDFISSGGWKSTPVNIGFDSEWDFRFMTIMKNAIIDSGSNLLGDLDNKIKESKFRVKYVMSHDEIGNWDGTRLIPKIMTHSLGLFGKVNGINDAEKGQRAAHAAQALSEIAISENFEKMTDEELLKLEQAAHINQFISKQEITEAFQTAIAKHKLAIGTVMSVPGPKMYFQADDEADLSYFKFFREFSDDKMHREQSPHLKYAEIRHKGYDTLEEEARPDSIIRTRKPGGKFKKLTQQMQLFSKDLSTLVKNNPALSNGKIIETYNDYNHNVHIHRLRSDDNQEMLVIKNFGNGFHDKNYEYFGFPQKSGWMEIFNSDDVRYGGLGKINAGRYDITNLNQRLNLAPNSLIILEKLKIKSFFSAE